jgi:hypothetical protein
MDKRQLFERILQESGRSLGDEVFNLISHGRTATVAVEDSPYDSWELTLDHGEIRVVDSYNEISNTLPKSLEAVNEWIELMEEEGDRLYLED